jgi:GH25 family lysozyme M1 (1,4-beta-N-acetylmuramidase)
MIEGTDLSYSTTRVNYQKMHDDGILFAINKLGQGIAVDVLAATHKEGCEKADVLDSWYWFGDYRIGAPAQAQKHVDTMRGTYGWGKLGQWVDLEYEDRLGWGHPSGYNMHCWLVAYRNRFKLLAPDRILGLYTNPALIHEMRPYLTTEDLAMPLWLAHWTTERYIDHEPWTEWTFWQQAGDVRGDWCPNGVDYDYFNGTLVDLKQKYGIEQPLVQDWSHALTDWARALGYTGPGPE